MSKRALAAVIAAAVLSAPAVGFAQTYPARTVQMVAPFSPGTAVDLVARLVAPRLGERLGGSFVVENRMGAAGQIGTQMVAKAPADGHTLLFTSPAHYINASLYRSLPYDPVRDFRPVMRMSNTLLVLVVSKSAPVDSVRALIAHARSRPGQLNYASAGVGSTTHLPAALFNAMADLDIVHVPYKSGAQAVTDVMGGQVFMTFTAVATALPHVKAGTLKAIAVTGASRSASMPDVPTIAESGLPGYEFSSWNGMFAPAGTPQRVIDRLEAALLGIAADPAFAEQMLAIGVELEPLSRLAFEARLEAEVPQWARTVAISGAKPE